MCTILPHITIYIIIALAPTNYKYEMVTLYDSTVTQTWPYVSQFRKSKERKNLNQHHMRGQEPAKG